jgi:MinD superfamily P-loop ATPase
MKIACASGKGGTGKTTIATNLALSIADIQPVTYCDCDVEEPNGHIFLKPRVNSKDAVGMPLPLVEETKCTRCGECGKICQYKAIMPTKTGVLIFPELCHGCAGCWLVCPEKAIQESSRTVGVMETGDVNGGMRFMHGILRIGEAQAVPLIRKLKQHLTSEGVIIIDAPPGTSCPVIEAVKGADLVVLVAEPTPFGLHDLKLAVEMVRELSLPFEVVINRSGMGGDAQLDEYLLSEGIRTLLRIPHDRHIAEAYSRGEMIIHAIPEYKDVFISLWARIKERGQK